MAEVIVRDLEDEVVRRIEQRAERAGVAPDEEVRRILRDATRGEVTPSREQVLAELAALRAMTPPGPRKPAEDLVREIRDGG